MFARTALRTARKPTVVTQRFRYATAAVSDPSHFSAKAVDRTNTRGVAISAAQGIAEGGFVDGMFYAMLERSLSCTY